MKRTHLLSRTLLAAGLLFSCGALAAPASRVPIDTYIARAWSTLTRSTSDCNSVVDPKLHTTPALYLPHGMPLPADLRAMQTHCKVDVRWLPRPITALGSFDGRSLPVQGLLYLPHPYVVPGGRFNEMYGWDSYFIELGLLADGRVHLARGIVENFLFEVRHYGGVLNANRTYYLTRSQPPFLAAMVRALLADPHAFASPAAAHAWLAQAYPLIVRNYEIWTRPAHRAGDTGLARFWDYGGHGPVPEMDTPGYWRGIIRWLLAHPAQNRGYLVKAPLHPDAAQIAALARSSCNIAHSAACARAWYGGYRLSAKFYEGDRAMRESGFDTTFVFGPFGGSTAEYAPVGLNALLYRYEADLAHFARELGRPAEARQWTQAVDARRAAIDKYLWHPRRGLYLDYDFASGKPAAYPFVSTFWPLWAGAASPAQARAVRDHLALFDRRGGLQTSPIRSGAQWDAPFGWAPTNWLAAKGLDDYGFTHAARRIARQFTATVRGVYDQRGAIYEKYDMLTASSDVKIKAGYTQNVVGFGWTNAAYLELQRLLEPHPRASITRH